MEIASRSSQGVKSRQGELLMAPRLAPVFLSAIAGAGLIAGVALAQQKTISIGTGGTGGVYYPLGGASPIRSRNTCRACRRPPR
jgi:hypothetical protein